MKNQLDIFSMIGHRTTTTPRETDKIVFNPKETISPRISSDAIRNFISSQHSRLTEIYGDAVSNLQIISGHGGSVFHGE
jgi:hypothetical protein